MSETEVYIYTENDYILKAKVFGKRGTYLSTLILDKSMVGYESIITDPLNANKVVVFSMPEIGVAGVNENDRKSDKIQVDGIMVRKINNNPSNFRSNKNLKDWFEEEKKMIIYDVDTRYIASLLKDKHSLKAIISTEIKDKNKLKKYFEDMK